MMPRYTNAGAVAIPDPSEEGGPRLSLSHIVPQLHDPATGRLDAKQIAGFFDVRLATLASQLGRDLSTLSKSPSGRPLQEGLRVYERMAAALLRMTASTGEARMWLHAPSPDLEQKTPIEVIEEGNAYVLAELLEDMLAGQPG
jgi:hypothetical protein